jgi:hypothetical protein
LELSHEGNRYHFLTTLPLNTVDSIAQAQP